MTDAYIHIFYILYLREATKYDESVEKFKQLEDLRTFMKQLNRVYFETFTIYQDI